MATSAKDKSTDPAPPDGHQEELADAAETSATPSPSEEEAVAGPRRPEDLSPDERATLSRHYRALRLAESTGDADEAREKIRALLGADAEIGDHVVTLADGNQHRMEYAGSTKHNGVPILSVYESPL